MNRTTLAIVSLLMTFQIAQARPGSITLPWETDLSAPPEGLIVMRAIPQAENTSPQYDQYVGGPLFRGATTTIQIAKNRFPRCGSSGQVEAYIRTPTGEVLTVPLTSGDASLFLSGAFAMPAADSIEIWFRSQNGECVEWDSNLGKNYLFEVGTWNTSLVTFKANGRHSEHVTLRRGGALVVKYELDRMTACRGFYRGFPSWDLIAHVRYDTGVEYEESVRRLGYGSTGAPDGSVHPQFALFPIPKLASSADIWFENTQYPPTCHAWDSNWSRNFRFWVIDSLAPSASHR